MKKILSISLAIVMLFTLVATTSIVSAQTTYNIIDSKDYIRPIGRYEWVENGLACDWTATGFEFTADVEGDVSVTMTASCPDVGSKGSWNADGYLTIFIDGVRQNYRVRYISGNLTVNIAEDVAKGVHTFKVVKQNDFGNKVVFNSVNFSGTFGAKPQEKEVIEFVGDSITAGFGSLDNPSSGVARYSDGTRTWAYIIAENFDADARVIARSGGNINGEYNDYVTNLRAGGSYDYSLKKPKAVMLSFGTNDGVQSVNYWKTGIKKFADAIRTGYNDVNIPIVMVTNLMGNDEKVRENIANAIFSLQQDDATAYANIYNVFGITNSGGHPNQEEHLKNANRITRELVEIGVMEVSDLRDDATVTLTENTVKETFVNKCDSAVSIGKPSYTATEKYSGITSETVDPLDPADIDSETAKANKFTADGTQEETTDYRFTKAWFGGFNKPFSTTKGISFYLNYKDTDYTGAEGETYTNPCILLTSGDKMAKVKIPGTSVETDGKTMKVDFYWNTMPSVSYVFLMMSFDVTLNVCLDLDGKCEYIIDNIKTINSNYQYADNANKAYTYTNGYDSYPIMGVTDNYGVVTTVTSATTTTTTTTTVAPTVPEVSGNSVMLHDVDVHERNGAVGMWGDPAITEFNGRKGLKLNRGNHMSCGGVGVSDANIEKTNYETIILDLGESVQGVVELLQLCDRIYMPILEDVVSRRKIERYEEGLKRMHMSSIESKTYKFAAVTDMSACARKIVKEEG